MNNLESKFKAFDTHNSVILWIKQRNEDVTSKVHNLSDSELNRKDQDQLVADRVNEWKVDAPEVDTENRSRAPVDNKWFRYHRTRPGPDPEQIVEYTLPASGDLELLKYSPRSAQFAFSEVMPEIRIVHMPTGIAFDVELPNAGYGLTPDDYVRKMLACIKENTQKLRAEVETFNASLPNAVKRAITAEKEWRQKLKRDVDSLP
ncbi:MAG: hypothetical protein ACLQUY_24070 [Ktedonobacterales bacterium]